MLELFVFFHFMFNQLCIAFQKMLPVARYIFHAKVMPNKVSASETHQLFSRTTSHIFKSKTKDIIEINFLKKQFHKSQIL